MNAIELLHETDNGAGIAVLAGQFGLTTEQVEGIIGSVAPEILARIERNTLSRGGVADLVAMMGAAEAGGFGDPAAIGSDIGRSQGNALLEQIFATPDKSRAVAAQASYASGIGDTIIKAMLPYIASMIMKAIFNRTSGGLGDIMSKLPKIDQSGRTPRAPSGGGSDDIFSRIPDLGGVTPSGSQPPMRMPQGSGFPAPSSGPMLPGPDGTSPGGYSNNPYGDLSDVIRRGGSSSQVDGNPLWRMVRNAVGGALGFQSRGIMSWIVRVVVVRYGWRIVSSILRRVFTGR